jgi:ribosomal protein L24
MSGFAVGDRIGIVKGSLQGYYGHVIHTYPNLLTVIGVRLQGDRYGENNPRFLSGEWYMPTHYFEHID